VVPRSTLKARAAPAMPLLSSLYSWKYKAVGRSFDKDWGYFWLKTERESIIADKEAVKNWFIHCI
jgi:hypothetical protein